MGEISKPRAPVTNYELLSVVLRMQEQMSNFVAADGYGGRLLVVEKKVDGNCNEIEKLDHTINGNGSLGIKAELQEVRHDVKTTLSIMRWLVTPIFVALVGVIIKLLFL
jgi:hypothetical protein